MYTLQFLALVGAAQALQLPSWLPFGHSKSVDTQASLALPSPESVNRIAVIGAGAGGSSAAFWIAKAKERFPELEDVQVDVYEKTDKIGGSKHGCLTPLLTYIVLWSCDYYKYTFRKYGCVSV